jgi:hemolysin-activating ACP:hemolysin acyltransferase
MLRDALDLWTSSDSYKDFKSSTIAWRLLPAIDNNQIRLFYRDGKCVGLTTWAFMTREEFESKEYYGPEIFARKDGEVMVVVDMISTMGKKDVLWISKEMRKQFWTQYPDVTEVLAHRGNRNASFPNKGNWHDKAV